MFWPIFGYILFGQYSITLTNISDIQEANTDMVDTHIQLLAEYVG